MSSCKIITKCFSGIDIVAFIVEYTNGVRKTLKKEDVIKLAKIGKVENAEVIFDADDSQSRLVINDDANEINSIDLIASRSQFKFKGRIKKDNVVGIKVEDKSQNEYTITLSKAWELALYSSIDSIKAQIINGKKYISYDNNCNI